MSAVDPGAEPLRFYGLLFVDRSDRPVNLSGRADPLDVYVRCAATCARSIAASGAAFCLITNDVATLSERYAALAIPPPRMIEHRFTLAVPAIAFRSAHHKLELFRAFAEGGFDGPAALIDIDTIMLRAFPLPAGAPGTIYGYDITRQVSGSFERARMARDLAAVCGRSQPDPRWWGGEFIAGDRAAFAALADAVDRCWPAYLRETGTLHHIGDEAVTSAALAMLADDGHAIVDMGGTVQRWWSNRTTTRQPHTLADLLDAALAHLPADKPMLARFATTRRLGDFAQDYRRYLMSRWPMHHLLAAIERLRGRPRRHAPRLFRARR